MVVCLDIIMYTETECVKERHLHLIANIPLVQHFTAISATAELLLLLVFYKYFLY